MNERDKKDVLKTVKVSDVKPDCIELIDYGEILSKASLLIIFVVRIIEKYVNIDDIDRFNTEVKENGVSVETLCSLYDLIESLNVDVEITFEPNVHLKHNRCNAMLKQSYKDFLEKAVAAY